MARTNRSRRPAESSNGSPSVESVVATVRTLWTAAEGANEGEKTKLRQDITLTVNRLVKRQLFFPINDNYGLPKMEILL